MSKRECRDLGQKIQERENCVYTNMEISGIRDRKCVD